MKVIFSRKGVDSAAGRCASAIVDGRPFSLPIPTSMPTLTRYADLAAPLPALANDLSGGRLSADTPCHLDPDIDEAALTLRPSGWRGALGQTSAALSHLRNAYVGRGDVFLFWGLFRACEHAGDGWHYRGPRVHAIFGWLEVAEVIDLGPDGSHALIEHPWLVRHPHVRSGWGVRNAIFLATHHLSFGDGKTRGWGVLRRPFFLTAADATNPSAWSVPAWLDPTLGGVGMTYHPSDRWKGRGLVQAASRGQEFIANIGERDDAKDWMRQLCGSSP